MKRCCEPGCQLECCSKQKRCHMHWNRNQRLKRYRRKIPKPKTHKPGTFDLSALGAVGWRVRS